MWNLRLNKSGFFLVSLALLGVNIAVPLRSEEDKPREEKITAKKPVEVRSKELTFDRATGMTVFKGKVRVTHGDTTLETDELRATSENRQATAEDNVRVVDGGMAATLTCGHLEYRDTMKYMSAHDDPKLLTVDDQGQSVTLQSRQMEFFNEEGRAVANQDVRMGHPKGKAKAGKATFLKSEQRLILEEEPKFTNELGTVTGRRLTAYLGENRLVAEGNVEVNFFPTPQPGSGSMDEAAPTAPGKGRKGTEAPAPGNGKPRSTPVPTPVSTPGLTPSVSKTPAPAGTPTGWSKPPLGTNHPSGWGTTK